MSDSELPIVCNINALSQIEREEYHILRERLAASVKEIEPLENGCSVEFDISHLVMIARFVDLERLCCPFLDFRIDVSGLAASVRLSITGPPGSRELIEHELGFRVA